MANKDAYNQVSAVASGAGSVLSGIGGYMSAQGSAANARANAKVARLNAGKSDLNYGASIRETATNKAINLDRNRVEWAWGGLTMAGTPGLVNENVEASYNADIGILKQNQKIDRAIYDTQAAAFDAEARSAEKAAFFSAASGLLGAATSAAALIYL